MPAQARQGDDPHHDNTVSVPHFEKDSFAYLESTASGIPEDVWTRVKVLTQNGTKVTVRTAPDVGSSAFSKVLNVDLLESEMVPCNNSTDDGKGPSAPVSDLTELYFMNEASILETLQRRSYTDHPYTFMANVLVAINPLKATAHSGEAEERCLGISKATQIIHPYAVAEHAYQQMCFKAMQALKDGSGSNLMANAVSGDVENNEDTEVVATETASGDERVSQSVIMSGESGAGKTVSSKMILRHILFRAGNTLEDQEHDLTGKLLESNEILEAFGNAGTLRNHNSSRFGKFVQLWFHKNSDALIFAGNDRKDYVVNRATIQTYLLEKSRITIHGFGEYNYHVFYYLLKTDKNYQDKLGLNLDKTKFLKKEYTDKLRTTHSHNAGLFTGFSYLDPTDFLSDILNGVNNNNEQTQMNKRKNIMERMLSEDLEEDAFVSFEIAREKDSVNLNKLIDALAQFGFDPSYVEIIFQALAGILHLGNIEFKDVFVNNENIAEEDTSEFSAGFSPLATAATLLGVPSGDLYNLLTTRKIKVGVEMSIVKLASSSANVARDSLARAIYSAMFSWLLERLGDNLITPEAAGQQLSSQQPFIGIADVFGFETFEVNSLEQLLINYLNSCLAETFNKSVFLSELDLYKKEGLMGGDSMMDPEDLPNDNLECLALFQGSRRLKSKQSPSPIAEPRTKNKAKSKKEVEFGLLRLIDNETYELKSSDEKLCATFHRVFADNPCFGSLKPIDRRDKFVVLHYAGAVTYTIHSFIQKNKDSIPKEMVDVLSTSNNHAIQSIMQAEAEAENSGNTSNSRNVSKKGNNNVGKPKSKKVSVVAEYNKQVNALIKTLESTRTSFIRCIKPNASLFRGDSNTWFNRVYVTNQLRNLNIPQTVKVLANGFPTRLSYSVLVEDFQHALPIEETKKWQNTDSKDDRSFIAALFYAFGIEPEVYKLGYTKAFFRSGQISKLENVLKASSDWEEGGHASEREDVVRKFKGYYIRKKWKIAFAKAFSISVFTHQLVELRAKRERERLERERLEKIRRAKIRRHWRVAIIKAHANVWFNTIFKAVQKKRAEEAERQRQLAIKLQKEKEELERLELLAAKQAAAEKERKEMEEMQAKIAKQEAEQREYAAKLAKEKEEQQRLELQRLAEQKAIQETERLRKQQDIELEEQKKQEFKENEAKATLAVEKVKRRLSAKIQLPNPKKSQFHSLRTLQAQTEYLDPWNRLEAVDELILERGDDVLTEEQILAKAEEIVNELRDKRERENEKMKEAMMKFARGRGESFLTEFNTKVEKAREKDEENYERLKKIEAEKLRMKNELKIVKAQQTVNQLAQDLAEDDHDHDNLDHPGPMPLSPVGRITNSGPFSNSIRARNLRAGSMRSHVTHQTAMSNMDSEAADFEWEYSGMVNGKEVYINTKTGLPRYKAPNATHKSAALTMRSFHTLRSTQNGAADRRRRSVAVLAHGLAEESVDASMTGAEREKEVDKRVDDILTDMATQHLEQEERLGHEDEIKKNEHGHDDQTEDVENEFMERQHPTIMARDSVRRREKLRGVFGKMYDKARGKKWFQDAEDDAEQTLHQAITARAGLRRPMSFKSFSDDNNTVNRVGSKRVQSTRQKLAGLVKGGFGLTRKSQGNKGRKGSVPGRPSMDNEFSGMSPKPNQNRPVPPLPSNKLEEQAINRTSTRKGKGKKVSMVMDEREAERRRIARLGLGYTDGHVSVGSSSDSKVQNHKRRKSVNRQGMILQKFLDVDVKSTDALLDSAKQFEEIERLGRSGELSPDEVLHLKRDLANRAQREHLVEAEQQKQDETANNKKKSSDDQVAVMDEGDMMRKRGPKTQMLQRVNTRRPAMVGSTVFGKNEKKKLKNQTPTASAAVVCKNCFQTNYTSNGAFCRWCQAPLNVSIEGDGAITEQLETEYYNAIEWDMILEVPGGTVKMSLQKDATKNILQEDSAQKLTFFTTLCVFTRGETVAEYERRLQGGSTHSTYNKRLFSAGSFLGKGPGAKKKSVDKDERKASADTKQMRLMDLELKMNEPEKKYIEWRVLHVLSDFVRFNNDLRSGKYKMYLTDRQSAMLTPLVSVNDYLDPKNFDFFAGTLKTWLKNTQKALISDKISKEFFIVAGSFWEMNRHLDLEDIGEYIVKEEDDDEESWNSNWGN